MKTIFSIGFSNGYTNHHDAKWEIINGGYSGREFVIRPGNAGTHWAAIHTNADRTQWEQVRDSFAVQVTDGKIAVYKADSNGIKGDLILEHNDASIVKSDYDTLTMTGGFSGTGTVRVKGICAQGPPTCAILFDGPNQTGAYANLPVGEEWCCDPPIMPINDASESVYVTPATGSISIIT